MDDSFSCLSGKYCSPAFGGYKRAFNGSQSNIKHCLRYLLQVPGNYIIVHRSSKHEKVVGSYIFAWFCRCNLVSCFLSSKYFTTHVYGDLFIVGGWVGGCAFFIFQRKLTTLRFSESEYRMSAVYMDIFVIATMKFNCPVRRSKVQLLRMPRHTFPPILRQQVVLGWMMEIHDTRIFIIPFDLISNKYTYYKQHIK